MRARLGEWLGKLGAGPDIRHDVLLAAWEACANAVEHAEGPEGKMFTLHADREDDVVRLRIGDTGRWRAPDGTPGERGLGLPLMRGLMDRVDIVHAAEGTVVMLERRLDGAPSPSPTGVFGNTALGTRQSWKPR
jgi:anti-sigma regulatory factor (Ser/Thr protein kinase)